MLAIVIKSSHSTYIGQVKKGRHVSLRLIRNYLFYKVIKVNIGRIKGKRFKTVKFKAQVTTKRSAIFQWYKE